MQWRKLARLKTAPGQSRARRMLCCGRRKENGRSVPDLTASPGRAPPGPPPASAAPRKEPVLLQGDFRKVSGISSEIFRQIETVENDHDPSTAAALEAVERRGEMIVRLLEPRLVGGRQACEAAQRLMSRGDTRHTVQLVEIVKRPGQTLGLYIREGNGSDRSDGVFISRIALESAVYNSGCLRVGDEILAVNLVDVTRMSLDDVVIIMSIPRRLVLVTRQRRGGRGANSPGPTPLTRPEQKPPPVVVIKRELRDEDNDEERPSRSRSSRERRTGDGREMTESRSRLGLGLAGYSPPPEQPLELYYNSRPAAEPPPWGYKPPPPPSVITEQPKSGAQHFSSYYQNMSNTGTLESLAEKVHSFYPGRRMSTGTGAAVASSVTQSHPRFPRSGSDQHLPRVEYSDFTSLGRHSLLRSSLKSGTLTSRYGQRYEPPPRSKYTSTTGVSTSGNTLTRRSRTLDYSSDTEATCGGARPSYYYYRNQIASRSVAAPDIAAKFNSLPRDTRPGGRMALRSRLGDRLSDEADGALSAPELPSAQVRRDRGRIPASPSIFTSDEYRAWLRRAPSSSAICEQMRASREVLNQQRAHRFSCSAENIHDALKNAESGLYSSRSALVGGTLDRHLTNRTPSAAPVRSLSTQHLGVRSPSVRRMRQLLELGSALPHSHASPAPTPSATLPRPHRQIDINPAEFLKYKLDKPGTESAGSTGVSGMLWIHLLAGRGLRATPEPGATPGAVRDLYCVLECDRVHKARTVVRGGDLQFDWDESFELDLVSNRQLDLLVYSWDPQHRHKLCYRGAVSLGALLKQSPLHQLALKVDPRGTLYLRLRHTDPAQLYRRRGLPSLRGTCPALFGADLEAVVAREGKLVPHGSPPIPIVIRRCVEEVERRGLDIIGLYRLCGSATKKRLLREAFERNSRAVELSPDHVPDINVITGVLKDYLRELPEPLFTRCLYQMTVDALGVCLPDDPEGNAKLMLSILDCLPRANRATLVFLLDHLSLVVSASERNKMSAQALATALGPPLMLHANATDSQTELDHAQPIAVLKYLLQIWPNPNQSHVSGNVTLTTVSHHKTGRRGEPAGQRGGKASVSLAARQPQPGHRPLSVSPCPQAVPVSAASAHTVLQGSLTSPAVSVGSRAPSRSPPVSPGSSSESGSGGSGADTIKRGIPPHRPALGAPGSTGTTTGMTNSMSSGHSSGTNSLTYGTNSYGSSINSTMSMNSSIRNQNSDTNDSSHSALSYSTIRSGKGPIHSSPNNTVGSTTSVGNDSFGNMGSISNIKNIVVDNLNVRNGGTNPTNSNNGYNIKSSPSSGHLITSSSSPVTSGFGCSSPGSGLYTTSGKLGVYQHSGFSNSSIPVPSPSSGNLYASTSPAATTTKPSSNLYSLNSHSGGTYSGSSMSQSGSFYDRNQASLYAGTTARSIGDTQSDQQFQHQIVGNNINTTMNGLVSNYQINYSNTNPFLPSYAPPPGTEVSTPSSMTTSGACGNDSEPEQSD